MTSSHGDRFRYGKPQRQKVPLTLDPAKLPPKSRAGPRRPLPPPRPASIPPCNNLIFLSPDAISQQKQTGDNWIQRQIWLSEPPPQSPALQSLASYLGKPRPSLVEPLIQSTITVTSAILEQYSDDVLPHLNFILRPDMIYVTSTGLRFANLPYPESTHNIPLSYYYLSPEALTGYTNERTFPDEYMDLLTARKEFIGKVIWSLGVLLMELWTGDYPYKSPSVFSILQNIVECRFKIPATVPVALTAVIRGCTSVLNRYSLPAVKQYLDYRAKVMNIIINRAGLPYLPPEIWQHIMTYIYELP